MAGDPGGAGSPLQPYQCGSAALVRVERCGKSAPDGSEVSVAVNSIRSNTVEEAHGWPGRFQEVA